jgi:hypothetical protein
MIVLVAICVAASLVALVVWAYDERARAVDDERKHRRMLSELARHPSADGTMFCPMCRERVQRCLCG